MPEQTARGGRSVLIVEDDAVARLALVRLLKQLGYIPVPAATVAEGLEVLDGQHCAILDLELPDGPSTTILKRLRDERRAMPVAIASGTADPALIEEARDLGAAVTFRKPINVSELLDWLESMD